MTFGVRTPQLRGMPSRARTRIPEADSPQHTPDEVTEQAIRTFVKARLPRLVRRRSEAFLVEEMQVCSGRAHRSGGDRRPADPSLPR